MPAFPIISKSSRPATLQCQGFKQKKLGVTLKEQGEVEWDDGKEVDHVHRRPDELQLARAAGDPHQVFDSEEADGEVVDDPDDVEEERELHHPVLVGLQLVDGGDDEGDRGDEHHGQREEGAEPELFVI